MRIEKFDSEYIKKGEKMQIEKNTLEANYELTTHFCFVSLQQGKIYTATKKTVLTLANAWIENDKPRFHKAKQDSLPTLKGEIDVVGCPIELSHMPCVAFEKYSQSFVDGLSDNEKQELGENLVVRAMNNKNFHCKPILEKELQTQGCDITATKNHKFVNVEVKTDCNIVKFGTAFFEIRRPRRQDER